MEKVLDDIKENLVPQNTEQKIIMEESKKAAENISRLFYKIFTLFYRVRIIFFVAR